MSRLPQIIFDVKDRNRLLFSVREDARYLLHGRSSSRWRYKLPQSRTNVMNADPYYHRVRGCDSELITKLAPRMLALPTNMEWTTHTRVAQRVFDNILGSSSAMSAAWRISCWDYDIFSLYEMFQSYSSLQRRGLSWLWDMKDNEID